MPPPAVARRASSTNSPTSSSVGPKPSSSSESSEAPGFGFFALTSTPFDSSGFETSLPCQKDGICVANSVVGVASLSFGG